MTPSDLRDQLAAANNVLQAADGAVRAALMALPQDDALSAEARELCRGFQARLAVYVKTKR